MTDQLGSLSAALTGRYQVERELGAGGMATVYLALDLRHQRRVAIKVIRPDLAAVIGSERFLHEIRVSAKLQHPNIVPLFDSGEADSSLFFVMPYVEGESLRHRLQREKQLPVDDALRFASEIAGALDYAHRQGLIHRDIKPENVLLQDGRALVADFGIALAVQTAGGSRLTESGLALGTPSYMSPEQAAGDRQLDPRTDIYSLGCVVYEMLAGEPPHQGPTMQAIMARVMTETPRPLPVVRPTVPSNVATAVHRALQRSPADRFQTAAEFAGALASYAPHHAESGPTPRVRPRITAGVAVAVAAALVVGWALGRASIKPRGIQEHLELYLGTDNPIEERFVHPLRISPDGRRVVYVGRTPSGTALFLRELANRETRPIPGTEGASTPAFSPDGDSVAFFARGTIVKLAMTGGVPVTIATVATGSARLEGLDWGPNGSLVFGTLPERLFAVSSAGGAPRRLEAAPDSLHCRTPVHVPGYAAVLAQCGPGLFAIPVGSGTPQDLGIVGKRSPRYVDGSIVFVGEDGTLFAQPFNPNTLTASGSPAVISSDVELAWNNSAAYDISANGTVVQVARGAGRQVVAVNPSGTERSILTAHGVEWPRLSPNADRVAYVRKLPSHWELWVTSLAQGTSQRIVHSGTPASPAWTLDGRHIGFSTGGFDPGAHLDLWTVPADGGEPRPILRRPLDQWDLSFSRDGKWITFMDVSDDEIKHDLGAISTASGAQAEVLVATPASEGQPSVSPDGRWLAYISDESGIYEVYIRPFRRPGPRQIISVGGGDEPVWSSRGQELYYRQGAQVMVAALGPGEPIQVRERRVVFDRPNDFVQPGHRNWDVSPDGSTFVFLTRPRDRRIVVTLGALQPD